VKPLVIAHRGASGYELENSLRAFHAAAERGADGVELDVHSSVDGEIFVHHDERLGDGRHIAQCYAGDLVAVQLSNGELLPTLAQALSVVGRRLSVFVELKSLDPDADRRLLEVLAAGPNPSGYAIHSFDHRIVRRVGEREPRLIRGVLSGAYAIRPLAALHDTGATDLWQEQSLIDAELVSAAHHARARLIAWTVNDGDRMRQLAHLGVDAICTNYPDVCRQVIDAVAA
jgi:glycerophosphoryl diester phosphodiesterase